MGLVGTIIIILWIGAAIVGVEDYKNDKQKNK